MLKAIISTIVLGTVAMGCQATSTTAKSPAKLDSAHAAACSKCDVKTQKVPTEVKGRVTGYSVRQTMHCPDCKDPVANFFANGKFQHTCTACGPEVAEACKGH